MYLFNGLFSKRLMSLLLSGAFCLSGLQALADDGNMMMVSIASESKEATGKLVQAKVLIDAPPGIVWQTITNYGELKNVLPGYEKSNVLKASGNTKQLDIAMKVAPFLPTYKYQVQVKENEPGYQITLNRISGDFKTLRATYKLIPQNNGSRTLLAYSLNIDSGINFPGSQGILKANTEKSLRALERHIEAEARKSFTAQRD